MEAGKREGVTEQIGESSRSCLRAADEGIGKFCFRELLVPPAFEFGGKSGSVGCAGIAVFLGTDGPGCRQVQVGGNSNLIGCDHGPARAIGVGEPSIGKGETLDSSSCGIEHSDGFTIVGKGVCEVFPEDRDSCAVAGLESRAVPREDGKLSTAEKGSFREAEVDPGGGMYPVQFQGLGREVFQFDEFEIAG